MKNSMNGEIFEPKKGSLNSWRSDQSKPVRGGITVNDLDYYMGSVKSNSKIYQNRSSFIKSNSSIPNPDFTVYDRKFDGLGNNNVSVTPAPEKVGMQSDNDSGQVLEQGIYESSRC